MWNCTSPSRIVDRLLTLSLYLPMNIDRFLPIMPARAMARRMHSDADEPDEDAQDYQAEVS